MLATNYTGVFVTATATARQMLRFTTRGSIVLIASMSGLVADKGLIAPVYNSSKAALIQLARNLNGVGPDPGRRRNQGQCAESGPYRHADGAKEFRGGGEAEGVLGVRGMFGRLASLEEFKGARLFLLSRASSFMMSWFPFFFFFGVLGESLTRIDWREPGY